MKNYAATMVVIRSLRSRRHVFPGLKFGAVAYLAGVLLTYPIAVTAGGKGFLRYTTELGSRVVPYRTDGSHPMEIKVATWLYHRAHFAGLQITKTIDDPPREGTSISFVLDVPLALYLLPAVLLVLAGYLVADGEYVADGEWTTPGAGESAWQGAHAAVGYAPLVIASVFLTAATHSDTLRIEEGMYYYDFTATVSMRPDLLTTIPLVAVLYPIGFGALGGWLKEKRASM